MAPKEDGFEVGAGYADLQQAILNMTAAKQPSKHAEVKLDGFTIPLIGIAPDATQQECQLCHDIFQLQSVELVGTQFLCERCRRQGP